MGLTEKIGVVVRNVVQYWFVESELKWWCLDH